MEGESPHYDRWAGELKTITVGSAARQIMSLEIGIGQDSSWTPDRSEPLLYLEDDGYYWFLHPLLERLAKATGQYVDLYGGASFAGDHLTALEQTLADAQQLVMSQPEEWSVHVGTQVSPDHRELYHGAKRERMRELLDRWDEITTRARQLGRPVVCLGD